MKVGKSIHVLIAAGKFGNREGNKGKYTRSELNSVPVGYAYLRLPTKKKTPDRF